MTYRDPDTGFYTLQYTIRYHSRRYGKWVIVSKGTQSDGATGAMDISSEAWWVHDEICKTGVWKDGTPVSRIQAATVLSDILKSEGRSWRAFWWKWATYSFGCSKVRGVKE